MDVASYIHAGQSIPIFAGDHADTMPMNDADAVAATLPTSPVPPVSNATDSPDTKRVKFQKREIAISDESLVPTPTSCSPVEMPLPTGDSCEVPQEDCPPSANPDENDLDATAPAAKLSLQEAPSKVLRMSLSSKYHFGL